MSGADRLDLENVRHPAFTKFLDPRPPETPDGLAVLEFLGLHQRTGLAVHPDAHLTLDYLWWDDFSFDAGREGETVHGQVCAVVVMKKGDRAVRVWVDRKTGALMQAEELKDGKAVRRLWGTRIRKFGERWMANVLEVETIGSGHRTKITVEELK